jgi:Protein of unknown function (DUF4241)
VVVCDPFCLRAESETVYQRGPYTLPGGSYTLALAITTIEDWGRREALALLAPAGTPVAAIANWRALETLPVDAGTVAFATLSGAEAWIDLVEGDPAARGAAIEDSGHATTRERRWLAQAIAPRGQKAASLLACSTGLGDGDYPIFEGLKVRGERVALLLDFLLGSGSGAGASHAAG